MKKKRAAGLLLHITSLPSKYGIGDFGPEAYKFVDFLVRSDQKYWQILPLNHTTAQTGHSPYNCSSAFAGNPLLLSPELLYREGFLRKNEIKEVPVFPAGRVDYRRVAEYKKRMFEYVIVRLRKRHIDSQEEYQLFKKENSFWLDDFTTFQSIHNYFKKRSWDKWPRQIRDRKGKEFEQIKTKLKSDIERQSFLQYLFYKQWVELRSYCTKKGIQIIGDVPIYVVYDSPDVWVSPQDFKLDRDRKPKFVAGVPPDYFSRTGQLWGNPIYHWAAMRKTNYHWWMERIGHNMKMFDIVRIDHFRGLIGYWQVPAGHKTAEKGKWLKGPGDDFIDTLLKHFSVESFIAEDLGYITPDVREAIEKYNFTTMKVLQFAFDGDPADNPHIPDNYVENCIVYTGTHDNNTTRGWFRKEAGQEQKKILNEYSGIKVSSENVNWRLIHMAMDSVAKLVIIPVQDVLGLNETARMNRPSLRKSNWLWRLKAGQLDLKYSRKLKQLTRKSARA